MKLSKFDTEIWMTDHEGDCLYNLADTCVKPMTIKDLEELIHQDLSEDIRQILFDYGPITGSDALKDEILKMYETGTRDNITITNGAVAANHHVMMTLLEPGDHIVALTPGYQQFYSYPASIGCTYDLIELKEENHWQPSLEDFKAVMNENTKMLCLNSPNNPTGTVLKKDFLEKLIALAREYDCYILIDEIYRGLKKNPEPAISDIYEKGISTNSLAKLYSFAGLRLGWVKGPQEVVDAINYRRDYTMISTGAFSDYMTKVILENKEAVLEKNRMIVDKNKAILRKWLKNEKRVTCVIPDDGTVCFLHYHLDYPSDQLCIELQDKYGVFFVPGCCFNKEYHLRFGFTSSPEKVEKGLALFSQYLDQLAAD